jgi:putative chitinase
MADETVHVPLQRRTFFAEARHSVFGGRLTQSQVDGMNVILDEWEAGFPDGSDLRRLAYILGTTWWETGKTMQPVREVGRGLGRSYGRPDPVTGQAYYGRGFVQLTWKANYQKLAKVVLADLVNQPDLALDPKISAQILIQGMLRGLFTGKRLSAYFNGSKADWTGARRVVNGTDRAAEIADASQRFFAALDKADAELPAPPMPQPKQPEIISMKIDVTSLPPAGKVVGALGAIAAVALAFGQPQLAALLGKVTPEQVEGLYQVITLGGGVVSIVAGLLPSTKAE